MNACPNAVTAPRAHWRLAAASLANAGHARLARWLNAHFKLQPWPEYTPETIPSADILTTLALRRALEASRALWRAQALAEVDAIRAAHSQIRRMGDSHE